MAAASSPIGAYRKDARLRRDRDFEAVRRTGRRHVGREAFVRALVTPVGRARLGLATPRKYGGAVRRNRFRRLARAAFRGVVAELGSVDLLVEPRRDLVEPTLDGIARDVVDAVGRLVR